MSKLPETAAWDRVWVTKDEYEAVAARLQDLCAMILEGRETREDEPVRSVSAARFAKALAKARKQFAAQGRKA